MWAALTSKQVNRSSRMWKTPASNTPLHLHRHVRHVIPLQPITQGEEVGGCRPKPAQVLLTPSHRPGHSHARRYCLLARLAPHTVQSTLHTTASSLGVGHRSEKLLFITTLLSGPKAPMRGSNASTSISGRTRMHTVARRCLSDGRGT